MELQKSWNTNKVAGVSTYCAACLSSFLIILLSLCSARGVGGRPHTFHTPSNRTISKVFQILPSNFNQSWWERRSIHPHCSVPPVQIVHLALLLSSPFSQGNMVALGTPLSFNPTPTPNPRADTVVTWPTGAEGKNTHVLWNLIVQPSHSLDLYSIKIGRALQE